MKVIIMGLGSYKEGSGISAAKFFISRGADVLITDLKSEKDLAHQIAEIENFCKKNKKSLPKFVLGEHREADILAADMLVRNPGVPGDSKFLKLAKENNISIETDISIFMKNCPAQVVGVTGTRGKSTTATLIYEMLRDANNANGMRMPRINKVWLGGNIKISPLSYVDKIKKDDIVVLELSSWLLENFREKKLAPHVAVVTNIYPDHLNTYKNMAEYISAKKNIFACQAAGDFLIVNGENAETKKWKKNLPSPLFSKEGGDTSNTPPFEKGRQGGILYFYKKDAVKYKTNLLGEHNLENIAAALAVAKIFKVPEASIKKCLREFKGLSDRQELVVEIRGVKYINDTTATSPDGVIAALRTLGQRSKKTPLHPPSAQGYGAAQQGFAGQAKKQKNIILIAGGKDKNLEYGALVKEIKKYCKAVILFPGSATDKIKKLFYVPCSMFHDASNMKEAVNKARQLAVKGNIILLSPAAASFGLFKNEFDRGEKFKKAVKSIK